MCNVPHIAMVIRLLRKYCPGYCTLRHFSLSSLGNMLNLQHVVLVDATMVPKVWLVNVPLSTLADDLYRIAAKRCSVDSGVEAGPPTWRDDQSVLIAAGCPLARGVPIGQHQWPGRRSRGWRLDLIIVVDGLQPVHDERRVDPEEFASVLRQCS